MKRFLTSLAFAALAATDIRFNKKGDKFLYVTLLGVPEEAVVYKVVFK